MTSSSGIFVFFYLTLCQFILLHFPLVPLFAVCKNLYFILVFVLLFDVFLFTGSIHYFCIFQDGLVRSDTAVGTPDYISPEVMTSSIRPHFQLKLMINSFLLI